MTFEGARQHIERLRAELPAKAVEIMRSQAPEGETGNLRRTINAIPMGVDTWDVGTSIYYAKYVVHGRGAVRPVRAQALHWFANGDSVFSMYSSPVPPNDFLERTKGDLIAWFRSNF